MSLRELYVRLFLVQMRDQKISAKVNRWVKQELQPSLLPVHHLSQKVLHVWLVCVQPKVITACYNQHLPIYQPLLSLLMVFLRWQALTLYTHLTHASPFLQCGDQAGQQQRSAQLSHHTSVRGGWIGNEVSCGDI